MSFKDIQDSHAENVFVNEDHFGEEVTLSNGVDDDEQVDCLIQIDQPIRDVDGDEQTEFTGQLTLPKKYVDCLSLDNNPVVTCTINDETWDITDVGPETNGVYVIGVRRHTSETKHSNAFDLNRIQTSTDKG